MYQKEHSETRSLLSRNFDGGPSDIHSLNDQIAYENQHTSQEYLKTNLAAKNSIGLTKRAYRQLQKGLNSTNTLRTPLY